MSNVQLFLLGQVMTGKNKGIGHRRKCKIKEEKNMQWWRGAGSREVHFA